MLDWDSATKSFSLSIEVTDGVNTITLPCEIQVAPVNEHTPTFPGTDIIVPKIESTAVGDVVNPAYRYELLILYCLLTFEYT